MTKPNISTTSNFHQQNAQTQYMGLRWKLIVHNVWHWQCTSFDEQRMHLWHHCSKEAVIGREPSFYKISRVSWSSPGETKDIPQQDVSRIMQSRTSRPNAHPCEMCYRAHHISGKWSCCHRQTHPGWPASFHSQQECRPHQNSAYRQGLTQVLVED